MDNKAIFLDRDGTLNKDTGYLIDFEQFELLPGVEEALRIFQDLGYRLFVASNQSGVARGYFTYAAVEALHEKIILHLAAKGIRIEEIAFCPHHVDGKVPEFTRDCDCRKPKPGMLLRLGKKHDLDLKRSYMVGDKSSDAETGISAGASGIWLKEGARRGDAKQGAGRLDNAKNIKEFVSLIDFAENLRGNERGPAGGREPQGDNG